MPTAIDVELELFGKRLRRFRKRSFLNQHELAQAADLTRQTVLRLEAGSHRPHVDTVRRLAAAMSITPGQLVPNVDKVWPDRRR
ncbi:MAG TPA: helix-turn-helix transcriptional regulator [Candidatus Saccharimonadales bacterium]|nr:helix-turn-helix transcriptional regulator [Candidatus Saccharimonadales bacterium]